MSVFGFIIFFIAQLGYAGGLREFGINKHLSWITGMIIQTLILYVFAMLKLLPFALNAVVIFGILIEVIRIVLLLVHKGHTKFEEMHYFDVWMMVIGIILGKTLVESPLLHYDNYSHWALIVKFLLFQGHLPTAGDSLISFTSYPPATALFITQFVHWVGFSDGAMLLAQFLLIWASFYAIFSVLRDRTRALNAFILCFIISITNVFNIAIRMNNLLVDFILPVVTAAGIAGIYTYRKKWKIACFIAFVFSDELLLIKNSGAMYVVMTGCYLWYTLMKNTKGNLFERIGKSSILSIPTMILGYLPFFWWNLHVKSTFAAVSKHQISSQAYKHQLSSESSTVILKIGRKFMHQIMSTNSLSTKGVILINIGLIIAWLIIRIFLDKKTNLFATLIALDLSFVAYYISVFAMYIVSMPYAEAIKLDGCERYLSSMVILNLLLGSMALVVAMDRAYFEQDISKRSLRSFYSIITKNMYQIMALVLMIFSVIMMFSEINGIEYNDTLGKEELPVQMKNLAPQITKMNHTKILLVDPHAVDADDYYAGYVGRYYFFSDKVTGQENFTMSQQQFKTTVNGYQYVVIPEWHRTFTVMTQKVYHQHLKVGIFKVTPNKLIRVKNIKA
ncbi:hypothetical protein [Companilactobacillus nodensis]|uniref:hypothetical protein n=1 Tax=Companilactobacillus nodensis TaxID=460870 RepID=UPI000468F0B3|nr:hypothetical protein [Companilactobacillus nodensis]